MPKLFWSYLKPLVSNFFCLNILFVENVFVYCIRLKISHFIAVNSGFDSQDTIVKLQEEARNSKVPIGLDINSGEPLNPIEAGIYDNYLVKKQIFHSW